MYACRKKVFLAISGGQTDLFLPGNGATSAIASPAGHWRRRWVFETAGAAVVQMAVFNATHALGRRRAWGRTVHFPVAAAV